MGSLRRRLFLLLEGWGQASRSGRIMDAILITLILVNIAALIIESIPIYVEEYRPVLIAVELISIVLFSLEYFTRIWVSVESPENLHISKFQARLRCMCSPIMLIDLLAILPLYLLMFGFVGLADMRYLRFIRVLRILKLVRYSPAMQVFTSVLRSEKRAIFSALMIGFVALFIASSIIYAAEGDAQPAAFGTIPAAMWWAMATLTTVGYGDVVPVTPLGKFIGSIVMLMGIGVFGLWAGIMASGFSEELRRRGFRVRWQMIAQCPIFESLSASEVNEVAKELQPVTMPANHLVIRKGIEADFMYFVVSGRIEAELPKGVEFIKAGDYFGELGMLHGGISSTTFITLEECQLLKMSRRTFEELIDTYPNVKDTVYLTAQNRRHWFDDKLEEI